MRASDQRNGCPGSGVDARNPALTCVKIHSPASPVRRTRLTAGWRRAPRARSRSTVRRRRPRAAAVASFISGDHLSVQLEFLKRFAGIRQYADVDSGSIWLQVHLRGMSRIDVLWRFLFALWSHPGRIRFTGDATRSQLLTLHVVLREFWFPTVDWCFWHASPRFLTLQRVNTGCVPHQRTRGNLAAINPGRDGSRRRPVSTRTGPPETRRLPWQRDGSVPSILSVP